MGASDWAYYVAYQPDTAELLAIVQQRAIDERSYHWADESLTRPTSAAELYEFLEDPAYEEPAQSGTHSILDIYQVGAADSADEIGTVLPLGADRILAEFGTTTPSRAQFDAALQGGDVLRTELFPRWSGRFTPLFEDSRPTEVVFWGYSGD